MAKVIARAQDPRFQAGVAEALGVSPETVGQVSLQAAADSRLVDVRAELADQELAANLVNAVAARLAEDFRENPDIDVRVMDHARVPSPTQ